MYPKGIKLEYVWICHKYQSCKFLEYGFLGDPINYGYLNGNESCMLSNKKNSKYKKEQLHLLPI